RTRKSAAVARFHSNLGRWSLSADCPSLASKAELPATMRYPAGTAGGPPGSSLAGIVPADGPPAVPGLASCHDALGLAWSLESVDPVDVCVEGIGEAERHHAALVQVTVEQVCERVVGLRADILGHDREHRLRHPIGALHDDREPGVAFEMLEGDGE